MREMFLRWFKRRKPEQAEQAPDLQADDGLDAIIQLSGRTKERWVKPVIGATILQLADQNKVDWYSNCRRGTCARCRSKVIEGMEYLSPPNEAETARLEPEEIEQGYRLGCQAKVEKIGPVKVRHAPYF